ncbi:MAG: hypothetical protein CVV09_20940 [Gammaproteobacteria bacterium HGW-Gammaproteobacteria-13]|nr:MAG: hypothetical protein CVV09_20940 [Gammaproteobacteria bacterium HGW-Gammaproteobacteria-13]
MLFQFCGQGFLHDARICPTFRLSNWLIVRLLALTQNAPRVWGWSAGYQALHDNYAKPGSGVCQLYRGMPRLRSL